MRVSALLPVMAVGIAPTARGQTYCSQLRGGVIYCPPDLGAATASAAQAAAASAAAGAEAARLRAAAAGTSAFAPADGREYRGPGLIGLAQAVQQASRNKRVGRLLADGNCGEAQRYALRSGDLRLAAYVAQACAGQ